jgi:predicted acyl esterase
MNTARFTAMDHGGAESPESGPEAGQSLISTSRQSVDDIQYWQTIATDHRYARRLVPVGNAGGCYDIFLHGTLKNFVRMQQEGGSEVARQGHHVLILLKSVAI